MEQGPNETCLRVMELSEIFQTFLAEFLQHRKLNIVLKTLKIMFVPLELHYRRTDT